MILFSIYIFGIFMKKIIFVAAMLVACGSVMAQKAAPYMTASVGTTDIGGKSYGGFGIGLGHEINKNFAVEGGYKMLGTTSYTCGYSTCDQTLNSFNVSVKAIYPAADQISVYGRLGYNLLSVSYSNAYGDSASGDSESSILYGVGASFEINDKLTAFAEWTQNNSDTTKLKSTSTMSLNVAYKF